MSLRDALEALAPSIGIAEMAKHDYLTRGAHDLPDEATVEQIARWASELRSRAGHLFVQPVVNDTARQEREGILATISPSEKLTRARQDHPPVRRSRPQPVTLTPAQAAELASLPAMQRLAKYRELQTEQGKG